MAKARNHKDPDKLTPKMEAFCREYLVDLDATKAMIRAGYSARSAGVEGCKMLQLPKVKARLQALMDARAERTEITADRVLREIARIGFSDVRKLFDEAGKLKQPHELDDDTAAAVQSIEVVVQGGDAMVHKIKLAPKTPAHEQLGKHLKLFADKLLIGEDKENPLDSLAALLAANAKRARAKGPVR